MTFLKSMFRSIVLGTVLAVLSISLAGAPAMAHSHQSIIDGTPASEMDYPYVANLLQNGEMFCTGTLIGPSHVLTAGHCFFDEKNRRAVGDTDVTVRLAGQLIQSSKITIHPAYVSRSSACVEGETDAAIVELSQPAAGINPIPLVGSPAPIGSSVILAGYGTQGKGQSGEDGTVPPEGVVNIGTTTIDGYGDDVGVDNPNSSYFYWTFRQGESNTASGDSGGPAFFPVDGQYYLAGITCGGTGKSEIGSYSFQTRADLMASWVQSITGAIPADTAPVFPRLATQGASLGQAFSYTVPVGGSEPLDLAAADLPDGLALSGRTISGTPAAVGTYTVTLTASNPFGSASTALVIAITGYSPTLSLKKALLQFDNDKNSDFLDMTGSIQVTANFKPRGKRVLVRIGRFTKTFKLAASGESTGSSKSYFDLYGSLKSGKAKFDLTFERVALAAELATLGFPPTDEAVSGQLVALPLSVTIDGVESSATVMLKFSSKDDRWRLSK